MSPQDISAGMLKKVPYNLNAQSHDATFSLINDVIAKGVQLEHVSDNQPLFNNIEVFNRYMLIQLDQLNPIKRN